MESKPLFVDICCSDDGETGRHFPIDWLSDFISGGVGPAGVETVGDLPSCPPTKQKQRHSGDEFMGYSLSSEQSCMSESAINSDDDCLILDGDPDKSNATMEKNCDGSDDLVVISEKGQVACRDFPHPRHLCVKFPFKTSPHEKYCDLCHCYVCDTRAPCVYWGTGFSPGDHCHSSDSEEKWRTQRKDFRLAQLASATSSKSMETTLSRVLSPCDPGFPLSPSSSTGVNPVAVQSPVSRTSRHGSSPSRNSVWHPKRTTGHKHGNPSPLGNSKNQLVHFRRGNIKGLTQTVPCAVLSWLQKQQNNCSSRCVPIVSGAAATPTQAMNCARNYGQAVTSITQKNHRPLLRPSEKFHLSRIEEFLLSDDDLHVDYSPNLWLSGSSTHDWGILYSTCRNDTGSNPSVASHPTHACPPGSGSNWLTDTAPFASLSSAPDFVNPDLPTTMDAVRSDPCNPRITSGGVQSPTEATVFQSQSNNRDLGIADRNHHPPDSLLDPYAIGRIQEAHGYGNR